MQIKFYLNLPQQMCKWRYWGSHTVFSHDYMEYQGILRKQLDQLDPFNAF